jgi:hypothetical protein
MKSPITVGHLAWIGISVLLFTTMALGQEKTGSLAGTASDDTDAVLPGVTVTLTDKATQRVLQGATGAYGDYLVRDIAPGK